MPTPTVIAELLVIGVLVGLLSGLLGIGGALLMVPALTFILSHQAYSPDLVVKMAVATSLATIAFTSISSVRAHHRRGAVRWEIAKLLAPGILLGSLLGAQVAVALPSRLLGILFAVFVAFSATQMLLARAPKPGRGMPGNAATFGVGTLIGVLSAVVGAGGAFVSVPFMTWRNVRIHEAVATAAALGFPIAVAGTIGYIWAGRDLADAPATLGYLYLPGLLVISLASVTFAPLGAKVAHSLDIQVLRRTFAVFLYFVSAYFFLR